MASERVGVKVSPTKLHGARELFGREQELGWLDEAWRGAGIKVVTIVAWGGVGKTALVSEWRNLLLKDGREVEFVFDWSFYSQGVRERGAVSADNFLREALRFFGDPELAESRVSPLDKGTRLAQLVGERRGVLILDGLEPLQHPPPRTGQRGALKEGSIANLLKGLAARNEGLCVVTTREAVLELEGCESTTAPRLQLEHLSKEAGAGLLRSLLEDDGGPPVVVSTVDERREISVAVKGHALSLQLLGSYIRRALGDIRGWRQINFERADDAVQGGHAFRVMDAYVRWLSGAGPGSRVAGSEGLRQLALLRLMGLFDRPADPGCVAALRKGPVIVGLTEALDGLDAVAWRLLVSSLEDMRLVVSSEYEAPRVAGYDEATAKRAGKGRPDGEPKVWRAAEYGAGAMVIDAHPLVREYFGRELQRTNAAGWREGHQRLYAHLCESVPYWPEEVEGLQPLYQAVAHGCSAGRIQEACAGVYRDRILRGARFYSSKHLGAFSADLAAVACFFEGGWDRLSSELNEADRSWVLGQAAFRLRALGRLSEALEPMRAGLEMDVELGHWKNAAAAANNLSELELTLGRTSAGVTDAAQSVAHADRSEDDFMRMGMRTTLADARHQAGDLAGARELFEQAEAMQAQRQPTYPRLYSLQGHRYCDLLLSPAERAAWQAWQGEATHDGQLVKPCAEVFARATQTLAWVSKAGWLLTIALDHLTLGRAALYAATLRPPATTTSPELSFATAREHLEAAVDGLRKAGQLHYLPPALITRAWLHHHTNHPTRARADLDEAYALAERGPMPLFQADIHLTRARLFRDRTALAHARQLITAHDYNRRLPELADAEQAAQSWPAPTETNPQPMPTPPWDPALRPDVAILIALPEEFDHLADEYAHDWTPQPNPDHPGSDFLFIGPGGYRCVAAIMPRMGPTVAGQVSGRLLAWRPAVIINVGIAGGFKDDLRIGDVIVPDQVHAYGETAKVKGVKWERRGADYRPTPDLLAKVNELRFTHKPAHTEWTQAGRDQLATLNTDPDDQPRIAELLDAKLLRDHPIISTKHLASGSFVVASKPFAEFIRGANADIHAGEMEAAGMMAAAEYRLQPVATLVVRGISDHVDADKSKVDKIGEGALRRLAMANAWRLVSTLMDHGLLPRSDA